MKKTKTETDKLIEEAYEKAKQENCTSENNIRKHIIEQAQTQTKLECLKSELEFLEELNKFSTSGKYPYSYKILSNKISKIQQEIQEIENG